MELHEVLMNSVLDCGLMMFRAETAEMEKEDRMNETVKINLEASMFCCDLGGDKYCLDQLREQRDQGSALYL